MKIQMEIANGYKNGRIAQIAERDTKLNRVQATEQFVEAMYGAWIDENLGTDFAIQNVTEQSFVVDFTYEDDALAFQKRLGGKQLVE